MIRTTTRVRIAAFTAGCLFAGVMVSGVLPNAAMAQKPAPYSQLDGTPYTPGVHPDIDMFMVDWHDSPPLKSHGALAERAILTRGDSLKPARRGAVLSYVNRFVHASLGAHEATTPTTLAGEQEIIYVVAGTGTITARGTTHDLHYGIGVLIPAGLEFTMTNTGDATLAMYLVSEPCPPDFRPNDDLVVVDETRNAWNTGNPHWVGLSKPMFSTASGLAVLESVITVQFEPMTFFQPHSHVPGCEEVWCAITDNAYVLLGKQIRSQPNGTAYLVPPDGNTPHANFNVSGDRIKLFYFARYRDHEPRK